jgi:arylsulfatase A
MANKMLQRIMLQRLMLALIVLVFTTAGSAADKPNIIYILLDDAGYGDLSCYGQQKFTTPNIDQLAVEGMRFTQHYSGSTVCAPTRCCLMTGKHTGHAFVRGNREVKPEGQAAMPADIVTMPRLLQKAGYVTGAFGKWGLGAPGSDSDPADHFNIFYGYNCQREAHTYYPKHLWKNKQKIPFDGKTYAHIPIFEESLKFVRANKDRPFFLFLPVTIPHAAMHVPEKYSAPFRKKFPEFADKVGKYARTEVKNPIAAFAGMMTLMDENVGQLMALLQELGIDDNTLVLLSSDNGPHKEGGHDPRFFNSNGPFKGHKRDLYEGGIRCPLIVRWPGVVQPGTKSRLLSAHWDMLPTFLDIAGASASIPNDVDGISILPTLKGDVSNQKPHDFLYWEFYEGGGKRAVRFGQWKAVQLNIHAKGDAAPIELYDLSTDIGENRNVADDHPELIDTARRMFKDAHTPSEFWSFGPKNRKKRKKTA